MTNAHHGTDSNHSVTRFEHGRFWTANPSQPEADTMIVNEQGRIAWIGQATELPEIYTGSACRTVNLEALVLFQDL